MSAPAWDDGPGARTGADGHVSLRRGRAVLARPWAAVTRVGTRSIRRQLAIGIALVHAVMMTIFIVDLVERQRAFLLAENVDRARSVATALAASSTPWVLAGDVIGLEEVVRAQQGYPGLLYAMALSPRGRVLAHTDSALVGRHVADPVSLGLLDAPAGPQVLWDDAAVVDVAAPVMANGERVGWARVALSQADAVGGLDAVVRDGLIYTALAIAVGTVIALAMARGLTRSLTGLVAVCRQVSTGTAQARARPRGDNEVAQLGRHINGMLDALDRSHRRLGRLNRELEERVADRTRDLARARDDAEAANRAKSTFLATMSHELRTPLNAILGFSEVIRDRAMGADWDRYTDYAADIHRSGRHLLALINDVLDIAKIEAGKMELAPEPVDATEAVGDALALFETRAAMKRLTLGAAVAPDLPPVLADRRALRQVLFNLLSNATKFTPGGGAITVTAGAAGGEVAIAVSDTGIGIPPHLLEAVRRPFEQADNRYSRGARESESGGTGLGLTLVDRLAGAMGGRVRLDSAPDRGTTVTVHLPAVTAGAGGTEVPRPPAEPGA